MILALGLFMLASLMLSTAISAAHRRIASNAAVGSTYGAAGSLIAFVVWVYYSAQIFFFGAIFIRIYSDTRRTSL
jgi:membrane protein